MDTGKFWKLHTPEQTRTGQKTPCPVPKRREVRRFLTDHVTNDNTRKGTPFQGGDYTYGK